MDLNKIQNLKNQALSSIIEADTKDELERIRIGYLGRKGEITNLLKEVPVVKVREFERDYIQYLNAKHRDILDTLKAGKLTDEVTATLEKVAKEVSAKYE